MDRTFSWINITWFYTWPLTQPTKIVFRLRHVPYPVYACRLSVLCLVLSHGASISITTHCLLSRTKKCREEEMNEEDEVLLHPIHEDTITIASDFFL
jgi:hypothetical protein